MRALWTNLAWAVLALALAAHYASASEAWPALALGAFAGWSLCRGLLSADD